MDLCPLNGTARRWHTAEGAGPKWDCDGPLQKHSVPLEVLLLIADPRASKPAATQYLRKVAVVRVTVPSCGLETVHTVKFNSVETAKGYLTRADRGSRSTFLSSGIYSQLNSVKTTKGSFYRRQLRCVLNLSSYTDWLIVIVPNGCTDWFIVITLNVWKHRSSL